MSSSFTLTHKSKIHEFTHQNFQFHAHACILFHVFMPKKKSISRFHDRKKGRSRVQANHWGGSLIHISLFASSDNNLKFAQ